MTACSSPASVPVMPSTEIPVVPLESAMFSAEDTLQPDMSPTLQPTPAIENGPAQPSNVTIIADAGDSMYVLYNDSGNLDILTTNDARFVGYSNGYIYYLSGSQLRRYRIPDNKNPELAYKKIYLSDDFFATDAEDRMLNENFCGNEKLLKLGDDVQCYDVSATSSTYASNTERKIIIYNNTIFRLYQDCIISYSIKDLKEGNSSIDYNRNNKIKLGNRVSTKDRAAGIFLVGVCDQVINDLIIGGSKLEVAYYNTKSGKTGVLFEFPDVIGLSVFDFVYSFDEFNGKIVAYAKYSDGSSSEYYAAIYDETTKQATIIENNIRSQFREGVVIGNYKYCSYLSQAGPQRLSRIDLQKLTNASPNDDPNTFIDSICECPGELFTNGQILFTYKDNMIFYFDSEDGEFKEYATIDSVIRDMLVVNN